MLKIIYWYFCIGLVIGIFRMTMALQDPDYKRAVKICMGFEQYLTKTAHIKYLLEGVWIVLRAMLIIVFLWPLELLGEFIEYKVNQNKESE